MHDYENSSGAIYFVPWKKLLTLFLNWTEEDVVQWAQQFDRELREGDDWFDRESVVYHVVPLLIPDSIKERLHVYEVMRLEERIEETILGEHPNCTKFTAPDWRAARERVNTILQEYGESLESVAKRREELRPPKASG